MNNRSFITTILAVEGALSLTMGLAQAQGTASIAGQAAQPYGVAGVQAALGTAFTYQGQLKKSGSLVNGSCDMQFSLWNAETGGTQIGLTQSKPNVSVNNGLFTVQLDFGTGAIQGDARWLEMAVRCPAGGGTYATLAPRQQLTPAPYALALPGMWTQQNPTSPNVIGGYSANSVGAGVVGATIGGGGYAAAINSVTGNYGTVGGGNANVASDTGATVGGGSNNTASGWNATVAGGGGNLAGNTNATVGGGYGNAATGGDATIAGGRENAAGYRAFVGGGMNNVAGGYAATVSGGGFNMANAANATVSGGTANTAAGNLATIPGGAGARADLHGQMAYASGTFSVTGDAQTSLYVLRRLATGSAWTELFLDGNSQRLTLAAGRTMVFEALIVGRSNNMKSAGYRVTGVIERVFDTTGMVGSAVKTVLGEDDPGWDVNVFADNTNDALRIEVLSGGDTTQWVAMVRTVETQW
ncbi:MAG: hypothetical protein RMN25_06770 [Anaerolineae bacterium]|nr:hypothetical protein [Thermoflexales bacterium]MDW8407473.1 hypothetical protein [Anaerolineae bacterium]